MDNLLRFIKIVEIVHTLKDLGILKVTLPMEEIMEKEIDQSSEGLNQIFEIINAKGDTGEIKQIVENNDIEKNNEK